MRKQHLLVIRRDDHKRDALGAVFLGAVAEPDEVRRTIERYLGPAVTVRSFEAGSAVLRVTIEYQGFEAESQNLVRLGRSLVEKGRLRAAVDMFEEALKLDPLNTDGLKGQASLRAAQGDLGVAHELWVRAAEVRGYDGEILRGLAMIALREDRRPSARRYLEEALEVDPADFESRQALEEIMRQVELAFDPPEGGDQGKDIT